MNDDLNTAVALSVLFEMVRRVNALPDDGVTKATLQAMDTQFRTLGGDVLGIVRTTIPPSVVRTMLCWLI